jgi:hypothetical protein
MIATASAAVHRHRAAPHLAGPAALADAARTAVAGARLVEAFDRGALALDRLRRGGRQTVVVQHVAVSDGGQAVVAGAVAAGAKGEKGR